MGFKYILTLFIITTVLSFEKNASVLILQESDFPTVIQDNEYILIKFYLQWCAHCQLLQQPFYEIARQFQNQKPNITFAKIQCSNNQKIENQYQIQGYPTLVMFVNGQRLNYKGQRNKFHITQWLKRFSKDPLTSLNLQEYNNLQFSNRVSIVYHGLEDSIESKVMKTIAYVDQNNDFYRVQVGKKQGTVEMFRPLHQKITYQKADEKIAEWIKDNQKHLILPFADDIIKKVFIENATMIGLFNDIQSQKLQQIFVQTAKIVLANQSQTALPNSSQIIFTFVQKTGEHYSMFSEYLKIIPVKMPIVVIEPITAKKFIMNQDPNTIQTKEDLLKFVYSYLNGTARHYMIADEINQTYSWKLTQDQIKNITKIENPSTENTSSTENPSTAENSQSADPLPTENQL